MASFAFYLENNSFWEELGARLLKLENLPFQQFGRLELKINLFLQSVGKELSSFKKLSKQWNKRNVWNTGLWQRIHRKWEYTTGKAISSELQEPICLRNRSAFLSQTSSKERNISPHNFLGCVLKLTGTAFFLCAQEKTSTQISELSGIKKLITLLDTSIVLRIQKSYKEMMHSKLTWRKCEWIK